MLTFQRPPAVLAHTSSRSAGTRSVLVKFTKDARKKLETRSKLKLALSVTLSDAAGHTGRARLTVTLRL